MIRPKHGILHDYDLMANAEPAAKNQRCVICDASPVTYQWSDYSGEAMCTCCGTPYQLKWGSDEQVAKGEYPYLNLLPAIVPFVREYYAETKRFTLLGTIMGGDFASLGAFWDWMESKHPEACEQFKITKEPNQ